MRECQFSVEVHSNDSIRSRCRRVEPDEEGNLGPSTSREVEGASRELRTVERHRPSARARLKATERRTTHRFSVWIVALDRDPARAQTRSGRNIGVH